MRFRLKPGWNIYEKNATQDLVSWQKIVKEQKESDFMSTGFVATWILKFVLLNISASEKHVCWLLFILVGSHSNDRLDNSWKMFICIASRHRLKKMQKRLFFLPLSPAPPCVVRENRFWMKWAHSGDRLGNIIFIRIIQPAEKDAYSYSYSWEALQYDFLKDEMGSSDWITPGKSLSSLYLTPTEKDAKILIFVLSMSANVLYEIAN